MNAPNKTDKRPDRTARAAAAGVFTRGRMRDDVPRGRFSRGASSVLALCVAVTRRACREYRRRAGAPDGAGARRRRTSATRSSRVTWRGLPADARRRHLRRRRSCSARRTRSRCSKDCNIDETFPFSLTGNQQTGVTQQDGTGHVFIDIMTTARLPSLACSETHPCSLLLYENPPDGFDPSTCPTAYAIVPLDFRQERRRLPAVRRFDFRIETESSAAPALYQWAADFCTGQEPSRSTSRTRRRTRLARLLREARRHRGLVAAAAAGEVTTTSPTFSVVPLDLTAVVVAYNIIDPVTDKQITDLTLTPRLVARLISDSDILTFFHDPEFQKLNPDHSWPLQAAEPGLRAEQNADTWIVTNWLNGDRERAEVPRRQGPLRRPGEPGVEGREVPDRRVRGPRPRTACTFRARGRRRRAATVRHDEAGRQRPDESGQRRVHRRPRPSDRTAVQRCRSRSSRTASASRSSTLDAESIEAGYHAMTTYPRRLPRRARRVRPIRPRTRSRRSTTRWCPTTLDERSHATRGIRALLDYAVGPGQETLARRASSRSPAALRLQTLRNRSRATSATDATDDHDTATAHPASPVVRRRGSVHRHRAARLPPRTDVGTTPARRPPHGHGGVRAESTVVAETVGLRRSRAGVADRPRPGCSRAVRIADSCSVAPASSRSRSAAADLDAGTSSREPQ